MSDDDKRLIFRTILDNFLSAGFEEGLLRYNQIGMMSAADQNALEGERTASRWDLICCLGILARGKRRLFVDRYGSHDLVGVAWRCLRCVVWKLSSRDNNVGYGGRHGGR